MSDSTIVVPNLDSRAAWFRSCQRCLAAGVACVVEKCRRLTSSVKMYCRASVIGSRATPYEQYVSGYMTALDESSTRSSKKIQAVVSQVGLA